ncbi:hypothetical protein ACI48D_20060 [Massilia sp. LXY-6]|uniref:hypothetical protein n=1 Tax=Massilia sp. LXY-6 TaxID=3379823 RepID=UPI003EDEF6B9
MMPLLYPPLKLLRSDLFGKEAPLPPDLETYQDPVAEEDAETPAPVMPPYLLELIRLRNAVQTAHPPAPLAVGQVRRLDRIPGADGRALGRSCAVLLGASLGGKRWSGWMVAQEVDYASERDLVLQDSDGLFAPEAGMVQAWNPVEVALQGNEPILGQLGAAGLGAVLLLADTDTPGDEFVAPRPGHIGAWDIAPHTTIVSGTPLGADDDPRHEYRQLYHQLANELRIAATTRVAMSASTRRRRLSEWLRGSFVRSAVACAALAIIAGQGIWMLQQRSAARDTVYRGSSQVGHAEPCAVLIRIVFRPDASYADLVDTLRAADATLVSGPSSNGELWVLPPRGRDPHELAAMLRQQFVVEQSDVIEPDRHRCAE